MCWLGVADWLIRSWSHRKHFQESVYIFSFSSFSTELAVFLFSIKFYFFLRIFCCLPDESVAGPSSGAGGPWVIYYFSFRFFVRSFQSIGARCEKTLFVPPFVWLSFTSTATDYRPRANNKPEKDCGLSISAFISHLVSQLIQAMCLHQYLSKLIS